MATRTLADISKTTDDEIVRIWLAERGLVAVERALAEPLAAVHGTAIYDPRLDRYYSRGFLQKKFD